jgi:hypothetical protein
MDIVEEQLEPETLSSAISAKAMSIETTPMVQSNRRSSRLTQSRSLRKEKGLELPPTVPVHHQIPGLSRTAISEELVKGGLY